MKAKEKDEKEKIKLRYAAGLSKALADSAFNSFRDLALQSGLEPAHIQRISAGKVDVALTTSIALAEGLGISYTELSTYYDKITDKDLQDFIITMDGRKRKKTNVPPEKGRRYKTLESKMKKKPGNRHK